VYLRCDRSLVSIRVVVSEIFARYWIDEIKSVPMSCDIPKIYVS
jgi:hypothetical protein